MFYFLLAFIVSEFYTVCFDQFIPHPQLLPEPPSFPTQPNMCLLLKNAY